MGAQRPSAAKHTPEYPAAGQALDRVSAVTYSPSATSGGALAGSRGAAETTSYSHDLLGHLTSVTRSQGESESLVYAPGGELLTGLG